MPRGLVIGATSLLGSTIAKTADPTRRLQPTCSRHARGEHTTAWRRLNVEDESAWVPIADEAPDLVLYCAGVCNVARCEADPSFARRVNVEGVRAMVNALPASTRLVLCSSDHVFAGRPEPYVESSTPDPRSEYGRMRLAAEHLVMRARPDALIVRVALPIGPSPTGRLGHLDWLRYRHANGLSMTVIEGEYRAAVWAEQAARRILDLADSGIAGIRHIAASRPCHRPALAEHLCRCLDIDPAYEVRHKDTLETPHPGHIDLRSEYDDALATPLPSPLDADDFAAGAIPRTRPIPAPR